jgi:hypothetical protein
MTEQTIDDPARRRRELREQISAKSVRLLDLSRRTDASGRVSPAVPPARPEPAGEGDGEQSPPPAAARPCGDAGAGRGAASPRGDLRSRIRAAEAAGDVRESIHLKNQQLAGYGDDHYGVLYGALQGVLLGRGA